MNAHENVCLQGAAAVHPARGHRGVALLAVLFALTLLAVLALPFAVSMGVGADAAARDLEVAQVEQAAASVRDLLLADASLSHPALDGTPDHDSLDEWPAEVTLPEAFASLTEDRKVLLGGSVWDQQRFLGLDGASPLVLANLLGASARLAGDLAPDATAVELDDATHLPDSGCVWVQHEVIRYGQKQGNVLHEVQRSQFPELGFNKATEPVPETALVLDFRCVLAASWPFLGRGDAARATRRPYAAVAELAEIAGAGAGGFRQAELDRFLAALSVDTQAETAATWGRPERVFTDVTPGDRVLRVKSALHVGAGSTVRLRDLTTGAVEYGLVMASSNERFVPDLQLPSIFRLELLLPPLRAFPAIDTVVEPLVPAPVNANTAGVDVLAALLREVRRAPALRVHEAGAGQRQTPPRGITAAEAKTFAEDLVALRAGDGPGQGPLQGWQDFCERVMRPRLESASSDPAKMVWLYGYRNLQTGRDSTMEMGTAPLCFTSGPWVGYRAAASRSRSVVAPGVAARQERTGTAVVAPGIPVEREWSTQARLEEAFLLDRRAPYWLTGPVNVGALAVDQNGNGDLGNDPASRYLAHLVPLAFPSAGFGAPRYPSRDTAEARIQPAPGIAVPRQWGREILRHDSFGLALDPRGRDLGREGPYEMQNVGPRGGQSGAAAAGGGRHDRISFPFSNQYGFVDRFAVSAWFEPKSLAVATLFDHGDGDERRNRIRLAAEDGHLVFEVLDEAGLDPDWSASPAGVERTATQWRVPLTDLALPAETPLHVSMSAYGGRPSELSLAVDGMPRGEGKFFTYLTAALQNFDPSLANNQAMPPNSSDERYFDLQVENTKDFPDTGILRIGTELFEYTGKTSTSFECRFRDSTGGRGARQSAREHRPGIPTDQNGEPTVDVEALAAQGVNLDVFPDHPAGSLVELYGYSSLLAEDSPMMTGSTTLGAAVGGFTVARGWVSNPAAVTAQVNTLNGTITVPLGQGIDENWSGGSLELLDPVAVEDTSPAEASETICNGFPTTGGYFLLMQVRSSDDPKVGGVELLQYTGRNGNKLTGVRRGATLPGDNANIDSAEYDGTARRFVTNWTLRFPTGQQTPNEVPTWILWVVPISLPVASTAQLWDPQTTGYSEFVQLYPQGGDPDDTEWVRYDCIGGGQHIARGFRGAWSQVYFTLTRRERVQVGVLNPRQPNLNNPSSFTAPWGTVTETSDYIGYLPRVEQDFPQVKAARDRLQFRGDPFTRTSSHAHQNSLVTQCQRLQLHPGNYGAFTGRVGRHDRVAIVQGSIATGDTRPAIEWHTVNWACRRLTGDNLQTTRPTERLGPWPMQLVAFQAGVQGSYLGPPRGTVVLEARQYDRVVKFPSGELPAAYCESPKLGGAVSGGTNLEGYVDELDVVQHEAMNLVVEEVFAASAESLVTVVEDLGGSQSSMTYTSYGPLWFAQQLSDQFPAGGGLLWIDGEIVAYKSRANGTFEIAENGRGLLGTEARDHDRGARVHFLTHRPAAILSGGVGPRDDVLRVQALGAMPRSGTALLGRELLHYTWARVQGDQGSLEMPRWLPPGEDQRSPQARGLFRNRFATSPQGGSSGEVVIAWPFRYWDRHAEQSDDPELAYFQCTTTEAPSFFRAVSWREETQDASVGVVCLARTDSKAPWWSDPATTPGFWSLRRTAGDDRGSPLGGQGARLEVRFATAYRPGCFDLVTGKLHGWKTTARIDKVRVTYDSQGRVVDEQVTAR